MMKILNILGHMYLSLDDKHIVAVNEKFPDKEGEFPCFDKNYSYDHYKFYVIISDPSRGIYNEEVSRYLIDKFKISSSVELVRIGNYIVERCSYSEKLIKDFQKWIKS